MFKPKKAHVMPAGYRAALKRMTALDPIARRETLKRAQAVASSLEETAEVARIASLTPAARAYELGEKARKARLDANYAAYAMTDAASLDAARPKAPVAAQRPSLPAGVLPPGVQVPRDVVAEAVAAAEARSLGLAQVHSQALKLGVDFDLQAALAGRITVAAAREQIFEAAAEADEALVIRNRSTSHTIEQANAGEGWDRSLAAVAARRGLKVREPEE